MAVPLPAKRIGLLAALLAAPLLVLAPEPLPGGVEEAAAKGCANARKSPKRLTRRQAKRAVRCLVRRKRVRRGSGRVKRKYHLKRSAQRHTRKMQRKRCFDHVCSGEPSLRKRIARTGYFSGASYYGYGEVIAKGRRGRGSPRGAIRQWMRSAGHRAALLDSSYEHLGVGVKWGTPKSPRSRNAATYTVDLGFRR